MDLFLTMELKNKFYIFLVVMCVRSERYWFSVTLSWKWMVFDHGASVTLLWKWMVFDHGDGHFESLAENICGLQSMQVGISGQLQITYLGYLLCFIIAKFEGLLAG